MYPGNMRNKSQIILHVLARNHRSIFLAREDRERTGRPHATLALQFSRYDHLPGMNWKSQNDEACKRNDALSIGRYIPFLLAALKYARMYPAESFSMSKIVILTGLVVIVIVLILMNLLSEIAIIVMSTNENVVADAIGVFTTHLGGLLKWSYCTTKNRRLLDIMMKLEKCHVLCQRIDSTKEGM